MKQHTYILLALTLAVSAASCSSERRPADDGLENADLPETSSSAPATTAVVTTTDPPGRTFSIQGTIMSGGGFEYAVMARVTLAEPVRTQLSPTQTNVTQRYTLNYSVANKNTRFVSPLQPSSLSIALLYPDDQNRPAFSNDPRPPCTSYSWFSFQGKDLCYFEIGLGGAGPTSIPAGQTVSGSFSGNLDRKVPGETTPVGVGLLGTARLDTDNATPEVSGFEGYCGMVSIGAGNHSLLLAGFGTAVTGARTLTSVDRWTCKEA